MPCYPMCEICHVLLLSMTAPPLSVLQSRCIKVFALKVFPFSSEVGSCPGSDVTSELTVFQLRSRKNTDSCRKAFIIAQNKSALHLKKETVSLFLSIFRCVKNVLITFNLSFKHKTDFMSNCCKQ